MGRTELQRNLSGAKNAEEVAGDARFCVVPRKTNENYEKPNFSNSFSIFFRNFPKLSKVETYANASEHFRTHPNSSEQVQTGPSKSGNFEKLAKGREIREKIAKNSQKFDIWSRLILKDAENQRTLQKKRTGYFSNKFAIFFQFSETV